MISLGFCCQEGHRTDAFYDDREVFKKLFKASMLACTTCGDPAVEEALSKPHVNSGLSRQAPQQEKRNSGFKNVGKDFFSLATAMQSGEIPPDRILGTPSQEEVCILREQGVPLFPVLEQRPATEPHRLSQSAKTKALH